MGTAIGLLLFAGVAYFIYYRVQVSRNKAPWVPPILPPGWTPGPGDDKDDPDYR